MRQYRFHLIAYATACFVAIAAFAVRCGDALFRYVDGVLDLFRPEPFRFAGDEFAINRCTTGRALDNALLTDIRHEAGVQRRASARNI